MYCGFVPSFVDESATVGEESAVDGVEDGKLSQSLHGKKQHGADNNETKELENAVSSASIAILLLVAVTYHTARATIVKRFTGPHEETSTNRTAYFPTELEEVLYTRRLRFGSVYR